MTRDRLPLPLIVRHCASPYGLALISYLLFIFALLLPPQLYSRFMNEPDLMFLDPSTFLFYSLCVGAFLVGQWVIDTTLPAAWQPPTKVNVSVAPLTFLAIPLLLSISATIVSSVLLVMKNPLLLVMLVSQQGVQLKEELEVQNTMALANIWLTGTVWWATWRIGDLQLSPRARKWGIGVISAGAFFAILSSSLKLGRGEVMPIVAGIAVVLVTRRLANRKLTTRAVIKYGFIMLFAVVGLFSLFSFIRGSINSDKFYSDLIAYSIASYNRLAALLSGRLVYPFAGRGVYISGFLSFNKTFNEIIPVAKTFGFGDFLDVWQSEFDATWRAGLNGFSIWSGAFGYIFAELGWWSPILLFIYGLMYGGVWRSLKCGRMLGIVLYPWFAFNILFWFGSNFLLDTKLVILALTAAALILYEHRFAIRLPIHSRVAPNGGFPSVSNATLNQPNIKAE